MKLRTIILLGLFVLLNSACTCVVIDPAPPESATFAARSTDGGATFATPNNISPYTDYYRESLVAIDGNIVLLFKDASVSRSTDGGLTFSAPLNVSRNTSYRFSHQIAIKGSAVIVSWREWEGSTYSTSTLFVAHSTDAGITFSTPISIVKNIKEDFHHKIAIEGDIALVLWDNVSSNSSDAGMFLSRSSDSGVSFTAPVNISSARNHPVVSAIEIKGGTVLLAWEELSDPTHKNKSIYIARSTDGGITFNAPQNIFTKGGTLAFSGNTILVSWTDPSSGNNDIFVARSADGGNTFSVPVKVSSNSGDSRSPSIALEGSVAIVAWQDRSQGNGVIFAARSTDGGTTFSAPIKIANEIEYYSSPQVVLSGSTVFISWNHTLAEKYPESYCELLPFGIKF